MVGFLSDFCGIVIADMWVERGDKHERVSEVRFDLRLVRFDSCHTVFVELPARVGKEPD